MPEGRGRRGTREGGQADFGDLEIRKMIDALASYIGDPSGGLPEEIFIFVSSITPMVNVDLLIRDSWGRTLLTWRDDGYYAPGWHIPGGIIRYKETAADRIRAVAALELGAEVMPGKEPLAVCEAIEPARRARGHFVSLLYECSLASPPDEGLRLRGGSPRPGEWAWHEKCPEDLIAVHEMYRKFMS